MRKNKVLSFLLITILTLGISSCGLFNNDPKQDDPVVEDIKVSRVSLNKNNLSLEVGNTEMLSYTISPSDAKNKAVIWESSNPSVATVTLGLVKGISEGSAIITIKTRDGNKTAACSVTVNNPTPTPISVTSVTLNKTSTILEIDGEEQLTYNVFPNDAENKQVTWESSNPSVAIVNNGLIKAISVGSSTITIKTVDGNKTATCNVIVKEKEPDQEPGTIKLDNKCNPAYSINPYTLNYGDYDFELANTSEYNDGYITLSKGGYILNTTAFGDIDSFIVKYSIETPTATITQGDNGFGKLYYVTDTHKITSPRSYQRVEVNSEQVVNLDDNPNYIAFYTFNKIDIESITITYNTTATYTEKLREFKLNLFLTNDIHGQVNPDDKHAGLVNASGYIEANKTKYNLLLDQGDIYQGSLASYLTKGHIMDDYLLMNGYDSSVLGNHEWDWYEKNIVEHREYNPLVKLLACNVRYTDGSIPSWVQNYYVTERGGVKIGVIGCLGDVKGDISAEMVENIKFIVDDPSKNDYSLTNMIIQYSDELKALGCDFIILQTHTGSSTAGGISYGSMDADYDEITYSKLQGKINLVCESHTHRSYYFLDNYDIYHVQCGGYLNALGFLTFEVYFIDSMPQFRLKDLIIPNYSVLKNYNSSFFKEVNDWYSDNVYKEESEKIVATLPEDLYESSINQLAADAYYNLKNVYPELSQYDIKVAGGYIKCRSPKVLNKGQVTKSDLANLFPFDNELYVVKLSGKDLKYNFLNPSAYVLCGEFNKDTRTDFNEYYYIIMDSYNYYFLTKERTPYNEVTIAYNLTEKYGIYPRDCVEMLLGERYEVKEEYRLKFTNTNFNFDQNPFTLEFISDKDITISYSGVTNNTRYNEITFPKNSISYIKVKAPTGYKISTINVYQYGNYANANYYNSEYKTNPFTYNVSDGKYSINVNSDTLIIENPGNYDVHFYYFELVIVKE